MDNVLTTQQGDDLQRQINELRSEVQFLKRLGPRQETPQEVEERTQRLVEEISKYIPSVDRSKLCTTSGEPVDLVRDSQTESVGQHKAYIVLCEEERKKGFVRPYRDKYKHLTCGTVTTMGRALSETYARDPQFYSHTFCVNCNQHLPVSEFVWALDNTEVGS
jgi:hypothetical protein